jgi:hypothetical protein
MASTGKNLLAVVSGHQERAYYLIDPKCGGSVLKRLFRSFFNGVTDFWGA